MDETNSSKLSLLLEISALDAKVVHIKAERKGYEEKLNAAKSDLGKEEGAYFIRLKEFEERKARHDKELAWLKEEQEKLVARRKAATTLTTHKIQQAAERDIEAVNHQLHAKEEAMAGYKKELDLLEGGLHALRSQVETKRATFLAAEKALKELQDSFQEREARQQAERKRVVGLLDTETVRSYERLRGRFPGGVVAQVKSGGCLGCFMQVGPQATVQMLKGELVKCPGCGRFLAPAPE